MKIITISAPPTHPDGLLVGELATDKLGFNGATPIVQPAAAAQAAVPADVIAGAAGANPTQAEYATAVAQINALTVLVNAQRLALVNLGLIKGAA